MTNWADPDVDAKPETTFLKTADLLERHVIIMPKEIQRQEGTIKNDRGQVKDYDVAVCDVVVLDGRETDKITRLPCISLDMWLTGAAVVAELRSLVGKGQPVLAVMTMKDGKSYHLEKASQRVKSAPSTEAAYQAYLKEVGAGSGSAAADDEPPF